MEESVYIEKLEVEPLEIMEDTSEADKVNYLFKLIVNNQIEDVNAKLDLKSYKKDFKDAGFDPARLVEAIKYLEDEQNKKMEQAEIVEEYMGVYDNKQCEAKFENLNVPIENSLTQIEEIKDGTKNIKDAAGQAGVDYKAILKLAKDYVDQINPNKKTKAPDIVLEGIIEEYKEIIQ
jgi:uncharacterized protein (UPF0335 family)